MDNPSLKTLIEDVQRLSQHAANAVDQKQWDIAHIAAKQLLGLTSRFYARCDGILAAMTELELEL